MNDRDDDMEKDCDAVLVLMLKRDGPGLNSMGAHKTYERWGSYAIKVSPETCKVSDTDPLEEWSPGMFLT